MPQLSLPKPPLRTSVRLFFPLCESTTMKKTNMILPATAQKISFQAGLLISINKAIVSEDRRTRFYPPQPPPHPPPPPQPPPSPPPLLLLLLQPLPPHPPKKKKPPLLLPPPLPDLEMRIIKIINPTTPRMMQANSLISAKKVFVMMLSKFIVFSFPAKRLKFIRHLGGFFGHGHEFANSFLYRRIVAEGFA